MITEVRVSAPFTQNASRLICKRYAHRGPNHPPCSDPVHLEHDGVETVHHESHEELLDRVSMYNPAYREVLFSPIRFAPNSPTWFNQPCRVCGQTEPMGTMSACFKFDVQDSMQSIMDVGKKAAMVLKYGGGVGFYVGNIRAKNEPIRTTHGKACGPIEVIKTYQRIAEMITQGGKRNAAQMAIIDRDHPDIHEFIHLKDEEPQKWNYFNISIAMDDKFMEAIYENVIVSPLWNEIVDSAWRTGDPGMYFKDAAERGNPTPWLGKLTGTNPCGEIPLMDDEPCNLGSINLSQFVKGQDILWEDLEAVIACSTRYLDEVLDRNIFPTPEIDAAARLTRKLGLGVMGWADTLAMLRIPYDSDQAVDLGETIMSFIKEHADDTSFKLADEKEPAPCFMGEHGGLLNPRNATRTAIAPTGSISWLADCSGGIEPHFELEYTHTMGDGDTTIHKSHYPEDFTPKLANEISVEWHLKHLAAFQKHTDLAVSKTINLPNTATREDISNAYLEAWRMGCKGITVFRDGCREGGEQVLKPTVVTTGWLDGGRTGVVGVRHIPAIAVNDPEFSGLAMVGDEMVIVDSPSSNGRAPVALQPVRTKLPATRSSITHRFQVGEQEGYLTVGLFPDGAPGELFVSVSKNGSTVQGLMDAVGILTSVSLQYGVPLDALVKKFRQTKFEPSGMTDNQDIPTASSLLDYVFRFLEKQFPPVGKITSEEPLRPIAGASGEVCPECGGGVVHAEGCVRCLTCDYNRCG